ncbi:hypothetical protein [Aurantimonas coralicida]|uniref:hypothetical protein n=1 Tax=Aurantimonas coralicida TaxID=182270 RepID=UPI00239F8A1F|nr:hypothetical protein [Aurantimonas coralicida]MDE0880879.1 hypothetical protein [Sphingomonas bacterium]MDE0924771.1 hypothetical protein [Aurantimonas coralicida]
MHRRALSFDDMDDLEIDGDGRLYWKGKAVRVEQKVSLEAYQIVLATMAAVGAVLAGIHPFGHSFGLW